MPQILRHYEMNKAVSLKFLFDSILLHFNDALKRCKCN